MGITESIISYLETQSTKVPLEIFVSLGAFIEEIITPIPSPIIMVLGGTIASTQYHSFVYLLWLGLIGAIGKTLGAWVLYIISAKLGGYIINKFGKYIGVSHNQVDSIKQKLKGGWKDFVFLSFARALPIIPSAPVSVACGIIKYDLKIYLTSALLGTFVRNMLFLYLGYVGYGNYKEIMNGLSSTESVLQVIIFLIVLLVIGWSYFKRKKQSDTQDKE